MSSSRVKLLLKSKSTSHESLDIKVITRPGKELQEYIRAVKNKEKDPTPYYALAVAIETQNLQLSYDVLTLYEQAAARGHIAASIDLGLLLLKKKDKIADKKAVYHFKKAHERKNLGGTFYYAMCLCEGTGVTRDVAAGEKLYEAIMLQIKSLSVEQRKDPTILNCFYFTLLNLGNLHFKSLHSKSSIDLAIKYYAEAAGTNESLDAEYNLATAHYVASEDSTCAKEKKYKLRKIYLLKLMELTKKRYIAAEYDLGSLHYYGAPAGHFAPEPIPQDMEKGIKLLWRAALGGYPDAYLHLGLHYETLKKLGIATQLYKRGFELGNKKAAFFYAKSLYRSENSSPQQLKKAMLILETLVEEQNAEAQYFLSEIKQKKYMTTGDKKYILESIHFAELSAKQGELSGLLQAAQLRIYNLAEYTDFPASLAIVEGYLSDVFYQIENCGEDESIFLHKFLAMNIWRQMQNAKIAGPAKLEISEEIKTAKKKKEKPKKKLIAFPSARQAGKFNNNFYKEINQQDTAEALLPEEIVEIIKPKAAPAKKKNKKKKKNRYSRSKNIAEESSSSEEEKFADVPETKQEAVAPEIPEQIPMTVIPPKVIYIPREFVQLPEEVKEVLRRLEALGYKAYACGGIVRNILCGINSSNNDIDIVTDAPVSVIEKLFSTIRNEHKPDLCRFEFESRSFDVLHDPSVKDSLLNNASKRDFNINALFANRHGEVFDPLERGLQDLANLECQLQLVRPTGFEEDPIVILRYLYFRACGFSGTYALDVVVAQLELLKKNFSTQHNSIEVAVSFKEKFDMMICKFFMSGKAQMSLNELLMHQFFNVFFPELQLDYDNLCWLNWRFNILDLTYQDPQAKHYITRNQIYSVLLAAMINTNVEDFYSTRDRLIQTYPFPVNLRLRQSFLKQVELWFNEKILYPCIPYEFKEEFSSANYRTFEETSLNNFNMQASSLTLTSPIISPSQISVYQSFGYFGQMSADLQQVSNLAPEPMPHAHSRQSVVH
jgi:tRNA nucleotidyltransferase/poly(A) polymerase